MGNENRIKSKKVETYTEDMAKAIEGDKTGLIKKIIHEEEEHEEERKKVIPTSKRNRFFMLIGLIFIILALTIFVFLAFFNEKINTVTTEEQVSSIIFTDTTSFLAVDELSKDKIEENLLDKVNKTKVKIGGIEGIYLTENKKIVNFKDFINLIKGNFNLDQSSLVDDYFLFGIFNKNEVKDFSSKQNGDFFILLKVRSFSDILPVMREWENKMLYDLAGFWGIKISPETNYLFTKDFEDYIVENKNARALKDDNNNVVLMYVFLDNTSVIITTSESATKEVMLRLSSSKKKR